jgi:hypothetical protein
MWTVVHEHGYRTLRQAFIYSRVTHAEQTFPAMSATYSSNTAFSYLQQGSQDLQRFSLPSVPLRFAIFSHRYGDTEFWFQKSRMV